MIINCYCIYTLKKTVVLKSNNIYFNMRNVFLCVVYIYMKTVGYYTSK